MRSSALEASAPRGSDRIASDPPERPSPTASRPGRFLGADQSWDATGPLMNVASGGRARAFFCSCSEVVLADRCSAPTGFSDEIRYRGVRGAVADANWRAARAPLGAAVPGIARSPAPAVAARADLHYPHRQGQSRQNAARRAHPPLVA